MDQRPGRHRSLFADKGGYAPTVQPPRFPLRAPGLLYAGIVMFTACAGFFLMELGMDRGLILEGLLELGVRGAHIFWGVLGALSAGFVILMLSAVISMRGGRVAVVLGEDTITMPGAPMRPRPRELRYEHITSATLHRVEKQEILTLVDPHGTSTLARSYVGDAAFETIVAHVAARVPAPRADLPVAKLRT